MKQFFYSILMGWFLLASAAVATASTQDMPAFNDQHLVSASGISYLSGGVGIAERTQMDSMAKGYNLKLIFDNHSGAYLSFVAVKIQAANGKVLVDAVSDGPWFYAKLPAGHYRVMTYFDGKHQTRNISIGKQVQTIVESWTV